MNLLRLLGLLYLAIVAYSITQNRAEDIEKFLNSAREGRLDTIKSYLDSKTVTVNSRDAKGNTALIIASGRGQVDTIKLLIQYGANVEDSTQHGLFEGKSALSWACSQGRPEAVAFLLQAGANPHKAADRGVFLGKTPLMWGSSQGRTSVVRILISAGVDVNFSSNSGNFKGKNALMWASSQGRVETVAVLLEAGCDVNAVDNDGVSALMWASGSEVKDDKGHKNGLMEKAEKGHVDVVTLLLNYGSQPDMRDRDGITAIMYASFHGHAGAVEALLNAGADAGYQNQAGRTALQLAKSAGFADVVNAILAGPTIMTLGVDEMVSVPTCGWLLFILRQPQGTGITPRHRGPSFSVNSSCGILTENGLDSFLGDFLDIVHQSSVKEVVEHMGVTQFAAKVRATHSLQNLYEKWKSKFYPEIHLKVGSSSGTTTEALGSGSSGSGSSSNNSGQGSSTDRMAMCAHLWSIIQMNCLGSSEQQQQGLLNGGGGGKVAVAPVGGSDGESCIPGGGGGGNN